MTSVIYTYKEVAQIIVMAVIAIAMGGLAIAIVTVILTTVTVMIFVIIVIKMRFMETMDFVLFDFGNIGTSKNMNDNCFSCEADPCVCDCDCDDGCNDDCDIDGYCDF